MKKGLSSLATMALAAVVVISLFATTPVEAQMLPLDHFKCYRISDHDAQNLNVPVGLRDQFDPAGAVTEAVVDRNVRFCTPVRKLHRGNVTGIQNPDAHLKFYTLQTTTPDPTRTLLVANQFGTNQLLTIGQTVALGVPTQKLPHAPPQGLDHFKCYRASGESLFEKVRIADQFQSDKKVRILDPIMFCNPAEKFHAGTITPILHPDAHLTCYRMRGRPFSRRIQVVNQFGFEDIAILRANIFCVPSLKLTSGN